MPYRGIWKTFWGVHRLRDRISPKSCWGLGQPLAALAWSPGFYSTNSMMKNIQTMQLWEQWASSRGRDSTGPNERMRFRCCGARSPWSRSGSDRSLCRAETYRSQTFWLMDRSVKRIGNSLCDISESILWSQCVICHELCVTKHWVIYTIKTWDDINAKWQIHWPLRTSFA